VVDVARLPATGMLATVQEAFEGVDHIGASVLWLLSCGAERVQPLLPSGDL
jgi:hypothetical protein